MTREKNKEIYAEYLMAVVEGKPMELVYKKYKICRKTLYNKVKSIEAYQDFNYGEDLRKELWEYRYSKVFKMAKKRNKTKTIKALVSYLYLEKGFPRKELMKFTKMSYSDVCRATCG